jgi:DNA-binding MarR family transcriptional regulator
MHVEREPGAGAIAETDRTGATPADGPGPDVVDRIQAAWADLRPDLDVASIGIVTRIWRIGRHLDEQRERVLDEFGTDRAVVDVLAELRRAGPPFELSAGDLREASKLSSGGVSQRLNRLEDLGLITRSFHREDRRVVNVRLTRSGIELIDAIASRIMATENELLEALAPSDRAELESLLRRFLAVFEGGGNQVS